MKLSSTTRHSATLVAVFFLFTGFWPGVVRAQEASVVIEDVVEMVPVESKQEAEAVSNEGAAATEESVASEEQAVPAEEEIIPEDESQSLMTGEGEGDGSTSSSTIKTALPQADDASGALVYEYPIRIPPGRNGLQPDLKLTYTNQASGVLGWFGHGWDISIPSIERIAKKGSNKLYSDSTFNSSLTGELVMTASGTYVTRFESGEFLSYAFNGTSWTVKDKKGLTYLFGSASSSRMDASATNSWISRWMVSEIRDTNDNYVKYEYYKDGGQIYR